MPLLVPVHSPTYAQPVACRCTNTNFRADLRGCQHFDRSVERPWNLSTLHRLQTYSRLPRALGAQCQEADPLIFVASCGRLVFAVLFLPSQARHACQGVR